MAMLMLFQREIQTARLNDELAFHLEQQIKENVARGLAPEEARYAGAACVRQSYSAGL